MSSDDATDHEAYVGESLLEAMKNWLLWAYGPQCEAFVEDCACCNA